MPSVVLAYGDLLKRISALEHLSMDMLVMETKRDSQILHALFEVIFNLPFCRMTLEQQILFVRVYRFLRHLCDQRERRQYHATRLLVLIDHHQRDIFRVLTFGVDLVLAHYNLVLLNRMDPYFWTEGFYRFSMKYLLIIEDLDLDTAPRNDPVRQIVIRERYRLAERRQMDFELDIQAELRVGNVSLNSGFFTAVLPCGRYHYIDMTPVIMYILREVEVTDDPFRQFDFYDTVQDRLRRGFIRGQHHLEEIYPMTPTDVGRVRHSNMDNILQGQVVNRGADVPDAEVMFPREIQRILDNNAPPSQPTPMQLFGNRLTQRQALDNAQLIPIPVWQQRENNDEHNAEVVVPEAPGPSPRVEGNNAVSAQVVVAPAPLVSSPSPQEDENIAAPPHVEVLEENEVPPAEVEVVVEREPMITANSVRSLLADHFKCGLCLGLIDDVSLFIYIYSFHEISIGVMLI